MIVHSDIINESNKKPIVFLTVRKTVQPWR